MCLICEGHVKRRQFNNTSCKGGALITRNRLWKGDAYNGVVLAMRLAVSPLAERLSDSRAAGG